MVELAIAQLREAAGKARAWTRENPWPVFLLAAGAIAFLWVLIQTIRLGNMGFREKTFWDWMDLLLVPAVLALAGFWFSRVQKHTELEIAEKAREEDRELAKQENDADREIARDRQRQNTLDSYLDKMTELILEKELGPDAGPEVKRLARTRTIIALISLDFVRNRQVIQFLQESGLLYPDLVVDLRGAGLRGADLREVNLSTADLRETDLSGADLSWATLNGVKLRGAFLTEAVLWGAFLSRADLSGAFLNGAKLSGADLNRADLSGAKLGRALLSEANLIRAKLGQAFLERAGLREANLSGADLSGAILSEADLSGAKLNEADLEGATVSAKQLLRTRTLEGATMPDGTKYEEWIKRQETGRGEGHEQNGHT